MNKPIDEAKKLIEKLGTYETPTNLEAVASSLGAQVVYADLQDDDHCGFVCIENGVPIIGINNTHPETRKRFTLAHEIGHLVLHKDFIIGGVHLDRKFKQKIFVDGRSQNDDLARETEANKFAAELLMPTNSLRQKLKDVEVSLDDDSSNWENILRGLAEEYKVSAQAMGIKISDCLNKA